MVRINLTRVFARCALNATATISLCFYVGCTEAASSGPSPDGNVSGANAGGNAGNAGNAGASTAGGLAGSAGASTAGGAAGASAAGASAVGGTTAGSAGAFTAGGSAGAAGASAAGGSGGAAGGSGAGGANGGAPSSVRFVGRVDTSNAMGPAFAWSGTGFVATVSGNAITVKLRSDGGSDPIYFQPVVDGAPRARVSVAASEGTKTLSLASGLTEGNHQLELYRETEGKPGFAVSTFLGFSLGTVQAPPPSSGRLIEIIGDSISAGYGALGSEQHPNSGADPSGGCTFSTATESAYVSYGAVTARALGADASIIAASGWGAYSDNSGNHANVLSSVYPNTFGGRAAPVWSFSPKPQAVVVNLGTNDFSADMSLTSAKFTPAYTALLATVRAKYPDAWIYCALGPLLYGSGLANATTYITALVGTLNGAGDHKVKVLNFGQQNALLGTGCQYHPNATEHQRMATILTQELKQTLAW